MNVLIFFLIAEFHDFFVVTFFLIFCKRFLLPFQLPYYVFFFKEELRDFSPF